MSKVIVADTPFTEKVRRSLRIGDRVLYTGSMVTARDVAHRRLCEALGEGRELPVNLEEAVVFYAAPAPTPPGRIIGSIGPTTSGRMDRYTPFFIERGLRVMIGKGKRSPEVRDAIVRYGAVYFGAPGGTAALLARTVRSVRTIAYEDLGPEAIIELTVVDFPLLVINDCHGGDLYERASR
ncbi:MAG: FumA C-terminus/TtdB family hydratase beta subunit [Syntrophales bacterium]|nr:FumA C-terminus/TtdB family hydratase beta subunit [Syntrophales bacterium]MCK9528304.1 FumA C-terminus/TtdB family hydratase beta subunit [Syntrophales bacterium]MDX9922143.1 FumA C-terminus/TtdB family hydratase beta subunit [Syntrophales bacterium]